MHFELQFLDIMFRLTIFGLFLYKIISFFKQNLIPYLYEQIKIERNTRLSLIEKENLLISKQHKIETQIRHQHALFDLLEHNIKSWQNFLLEKKQSKDKEFDNIRISIEKKRETQQKNYELVCISRAVLPRAINQAEAELIHRYAGMESRSSFDSLIGKLAKNNPSKDI